MNRFMVVAGILCFFCTSNAVAEHAILSVSPHYAIVSTEYRGGVDTKGSRWTGDINVEALEDRETKIPVFPKSGVLVSMSVDGVPAPILTEESSFAALVKGKGAHKIEIKFDAVVDERGGLAGVKFSITPAPVSHFQITLPGHKEVRTTPDVPVATSFVDGRTTASLNIPMRSEIAFNWSNASEAGENSQAKLHATVYQFASPEDGVFTLRARIEYELLRGQVSGVTLLIPAGFDVTKVSSPGNVIADWKINHDATKTLAVSFQESIKSDFSIDCTFERALPPVGAASSKIIFTPVKAKDAFRERGIIALLGGKDVVLTPSDEHDVLSVGEGQIPPSLRAEINKAVRHTFKYTEEDASLGLTPTIPEHTPGRFDAEVETLFSLSDVSIHGSTKAHVQVKAGSIEDATLLLPSNVSILSLTAPSLRTFKVDADTDGQRVRVSFTQEMEGSFPIDVQYEELLAKGGASPSLPIPHVEKAEVEEGKFGIEVLSSVEVQAGTMRGLVPLELSAVPKEIALQTTSPLLLAYSYPQYDKESALSLTILQHPEIETQPATIDEADYHSLLTSDGLFVTVARYTVRNTTSQFLRLVLPPGASVWSASVQGEPVKPVAAKRLDKDETLIKIVTSRTGFPVEIIYAVSRGSMGLLGAARFSLPSTNLVITKSVWDVSLPDTAAFGVPQTSFSVDARSRRPAPQMREFEAALKSSGTIFSLPTIGKTYTLEKLFSNGGDDNSVSFLYLSKHYRINELCAALAMGILVILIRRCGGKVRRLGPGERVCAGFALVTLAVLTLYFQTGFIGSVVTLLVYVVYKFDLGSIYSRVIRKFQLRASAR